MKLVGTARSQYCADAPLIGIAAWHVLKGHDALEDAFFATGEYQGCPPLTGDQLWQYDATKDKPRNGKDQCANIELNPWHSHFFLIKGDKQGFGDDIESRAQFEAAMSKGVASRVQFEAGLAGGRAGKHGRQSGRAGEAEALQLEARSQSGDLQRTGSGAHEPLLGEVANWEGFSEALQRTASTEGVQMVTEGNGARGLWSNIVDSVRASDAPGAKPMLDLRIAEAADNASLARPGTPIVLVCVQGGPGTVDTVLSAMKANTPVLIVQGSGKAADIIAGKHAHCSFVCIRQRKPCGTCVRALQTWFAIPSSLCAGTG